MIRQHRSFIAKSSNFQIIKSEGEIILMIARQRRIVVVV